ncbi:MAG: cysteine hydrolase [Caulobacteraceae bacterium]|nr:cysteine hydrolase [Caulobacteraceae bacterium]
MVKGLDGGQKAALLISEMQNGIANSAYVSSPLSGQVAARALPEKLNALASRFRAGGLPVIHCTIAARPAFQAWPVNCVLAAQIYKRGELVSGSRYAAIHDSIEVALSDIVSERHHGMAAFTGTDLAATLRALRVDTVVYSGVSTNVALMGGSIEAVGLGFTSVIAEDCAAGGTAESHQFQITMHLPLVATVSSADAVCAALGV